MRFLNGKEDFPEPQKGQEDFDSAISKNSNPMPFC